MPDEKENTAGRTNDATPDPASGKSGLVGTGIGAAAGAAAGGAIGGMGGPVGVAVGVAAGAVAGGLIGKTTGEALTPANDDSIWRRHFDEEGFANRGTFDDFLPAFRAGAETWNRHRTSGKSFAELEGETQHEFEANRRGSQLDWAQAREAARSAWNYLAHPAHRFKGYEVTDRNGNRIGEVDRVWTDDSLNVTFLSVKPGWLSGAVQVFPATRFELLEKNRRLMLPYSQVMVREGPSYSDVEQLTEKEWSELLHYYGAQEEASPDNVRPA
jgi:hypothetical protein